MQYLFLIIGFFLLVKGADIFVDGASNIARFFGIPSLIIGLTIVSIGTSAPEASVSLTASFSGSSSISLGNIIGSNIFNTAVVIGICSLIKPIFVDKTILNREFPFLLLSSVVAILLISDGFVSRFDGLILFLLFIIFMSIIILSAIKNKQKTLKDNQNTNLLYSIVVSVIGACAIIFGGDIVVNSAKSIALGFNISENIVGLTIVAIGTSLPELVTSVVAAKKGESDIALGNVIGSSIFNLLFILGGSALILPMPSETTSFYDIIIFTCLLFFVYLTAKKQHYIKKLPAFLLVISYIAFTAYILIR